MTEQEQLAAIIAETPNVVPVQPVVVYVSGFNELSEKLDKKTTLGTEEQVYGIIGDEQVMFDIDNTEQPNSLIKRDDNGSAYIATPVDPNPYHIANVGYVTSEIDKLKNNPDVVDIVQTYDDLSTYDTTHLGNNDIVRVLVDETQDNKSSFYQWKVLTQEWILKGTVATDINLENGTGTDSLIQKYSGTIDALHFGNTNTGESATVFGETNTNSGKRALMTGKLNRNTAPNSIIAGLGNGRGFASEPELSPLTGDNLIVGGKRNSNENANNVFLSGEDNKNYGNNVIMAGSHNINNHNNVIMTGLYNKNTAGSPNAIIGGTYCEPVANAHLIIGCGTNDNTRRNSVTVIGDTVFVEKFAAKDTASLGYNTYIRRAMIGNAPKVSDASLLVVGMGTTFNAFEVYQDGHAEVQTQGTTPNSVVKRQYVDMKLNKPSISILGRQALGNVVRTVHDTYTEHYITFALTEEQYQIIENADSLKVKLPSTLQYLPAYDIYLQRNVEQTLGGRNVIQFTFNNARFNFNTATQGYIPMTEIGDGACIYDPVTHYLFCSWVETSPSAVEAHSGGGGSGGTKLYFHKCVDDDDSWYYVITTRSTAYETGTGKYLNTQVYNDNGALKAGSFDWTGTNIQADGPISKNMAQNKAYFIYAYGVNSGQIGQYTISSENFTLVQDIVTEL